MRKKKTFSHSDCERSQIKLQSKVDGSEKSKNIPGCNCPLALFCFKLAEKGKLDFLEIVFGFNKVICYYCSNIVVLHSTVQSNIVVLHLCIFSGTVLDIEVMTMNKIAQNTFSDRAYI